MVSRNPGSKESLLDVSDLKVSVDLSIEVMTPGKSSLRKHGKGPRLRV